MNNEKIFLVKRAQRRDKEAFCKLINLHMKDIAYQWNCTMDRDIK